MLLTMYQVKVIEKKKSNCINLQFIHRRLQPLLCQTSNF